MATTFFSGQGGTISFNSATLDVTNWKGTHNIDVYETTNTASAGHVERAVFGCDSFEATATANCDSAAMPNTTVLPGTSATATLNIGSSGSHTVSFTAKIQSLALNVEAKGVVTYEVTMVSSGSITYA